MIYYFAYGSNMDHIQMTQRCPKAKLMGNAVLHDHALDFTIYSPKRACGCSDVIQKKGSSVYGLLYSLPQKDLDALDRYEMHPVKYKRETVNIENENGDVLEAETYKVATKEQTFQKPSKHYMSQIIEPAIINDFPRSYVKFLCSIPTID